ncbi:universal stress protein [Maribacter sp.]|uniref:universal stress protein n=1 Tax=Maribacter sp. TaxID=1897614 RepID=UPI0025C42D8F|nr:universal stress protein [Maribacter sp.]
MKHILIPTDFSKNAWNALEYAANLFTNEPCRFYVLHVDTLNNSGINGNSFMVLTSPQKSNTKEKLNDLTDKISSQFSNKIHQYIALKEYGNLVDIVRNTVRDKKIELIVMGTKGAKGLMASVIGSNAGNIITKIACNFLAVPENTKVELPNRIAFPTDYNLFYNHSILNSITEILQITNARLDVVHKTQSSPKFSNTQLNNKAYLSDYLKELFIDSHCFRNIQGKEIKQAIAEYIQDNNIKMLVMVAKNLNLFQKLFFNNKIEKLSHHTSVPLLVMHE